MEVERIDRMDIIETLRLDRVELRELREELIPASLEEATRCRLNGLHMEACLFMMQAHDQEVWANHVEHEIEFWHAWLRTG